MHSTDENPLLHISVADFALVPHLTTYIFAHVFCYTTRISVQIFGGDGLLTGQFLLWTIRTTIWILQSNTKPNFAWMLYRSTNLCCSRELDRLGRPHECFDCRGCSRKWVTKVCSMSSATFDGVPDDLLSISISFETVNIQKFWFSLGSALRSRDDNLDISSREQFFSEFAKPGRPVVLLIDEFDTLFLATEDIRNEFLGALREIRNNNSAYRIDGVIATGTFNIRRFSTTEYSLSPFNVANAIHNPYFNIGETRALFKEFALDNNFKVADEVVEDIWAKSNGYVVQCSGLFVTHISPSHPGMVGLCGRFIMSRLSSIVEEPSRTLPFCNWESVPSDQLLETVVEYNTFRSLIQSLRRSEAKDAIQLFRLQFAGFLGTVKLQQNDEELGDFLTAEGVLLRPGAALEYRVASPLVDGLVRARVIPFHFPGTPTVAPPHRDDDLSDLKVLDTLIESLKFFDKDLIRFASDRSYKSSIVRVRGRPKVHVPRESVYDTELMRILTNWLATRHGWTVTGQWHLQTMVGEHKYSDIILKKSDAPPIVLEILATGDEDFVKSHINKTCEYMELLSAKEGWVIHFTCEDNYKPVWQSRELLNKGVNVVHFVHDVKFKKIQMYAWWKRGRARRESRILHI